ncbi:MAG TPA: ferritin-like domain-containing protein, partial [Nannocystaceae bacterium]|nr:ferritin-like domain-containing protein [Nannocystaceae bacterium]
FTTTGGGCGPSDDIEHHVVLVRADGTMKVIQTELIEKGDPGCTAGRIPAGLRGVRVRCGSPVGDYLAEIAQLEAASITAFEQLARELRVHGAPQRLIDAAIVARADEVRHARVTATLARRWGGRPQRPIVVAQAPRALIDVAIDNAIEGCIRETFGAASAELGARQAGDRTLRRALATIAVDETRHAELSWQLAAWLDAKLGRTQRRTLARARHDAYERMEQELTAARDPAVHRVCGLPEPAQARALYRRIGAALLA